MSNIIKHGDTALVTHEADIKQKGTDLLKLLRNRDADPGAVMELINGGVSPFSATALEPETKSHNSWWRALLCLSSSYKGSRYRVETVMREKPFDPLETALGNNNIAAAHVLIDCMIEAGATQSQMREAWNCIRRNSGTPAMIRQLKEGGLEFDFDVTSWYHSGGTSRARADEITVECMRLARKLDSADNHHAAQGDGKTPEILREMKTIWKNEERDAAVINGHTVFAHRFSLRKLFITQKCIEWEGEKCRYALQPPPENQSLFNIYLRDAAAICAEPGVRVLDPDGNPVETLPFFRNVLDSKGHVIRAIVTSAQEIKVREHIAEGSPLAAPYKAALNGFQVFGPKEAIDTVVAAQEKVYSLTRDFNMYAASDPLPDDVRAKADDVIDHVQALVRSRLIAVFDTAGTRVYDLPILREVFDEQTKKPGMAVIVPRAGVRNYADYLEGMREAESIAPTNDTLLASFEALERAEAAAPPSSKRTASPSS